ncbi:FtsX-like permease family protein [Clostridium mediterraneense]|uniref:FtsX-like permease family protein n=1 Tax=Clostridium mediterraneense TaxID=1805472 RepID=UPI0008316A82|nr:FtsX-like permease family protein [Clostridium mediterraneense]
MYYNLAFRNVKRSFRDYLIYFLTLTLAIALYYSFNCIISQEIMIPVTAKNIVNLRIINQVLDILTICMSVVLAFLIIYANNFLIRRRKKEFGIYISLGMRKSKISRILLIETIAIGIVCLIVGMIIGIFLSQALAAFTARIFNVSFLKYNIIFSFNAFIKTILCFGLIFIFISIFNIVIISKYKAVDLIYSVNRNQEIKVKNIKLSIIIFILAVITLGSAYTIILRVGEVAEITRSIQVAIILGIVGTVLFFISISGFFINYFRKNERVYFRNLNPFILRQLENSLSNNFISMSIISLMLFITICIFSAGLGMGLSGYSSLNVNFRYPYDAVISNIGPNENIISLLKNNGIDMNLYIKNDVEYNRYTINETITDMIEKSYFASLTPVEYTQLKNQLWDTYIMKLSDYNKLLEMKGEKPIYLKDNQYAVCTNKKDLIAANDKALSLGNKIDINNKEYVPAYKNVLYNNITNITAGSSSEIFILPDKACDKLQIFDKTLAMNFNNKFTYKQAEKIQKLFANLQKNTMLGEDYFFTSRKTMEVSILSSCMMASYIGFYIGMIFLIISGAILSIQKLSQVSEDEERYKILRKLGYDKKMINKALVMQIGMYFLIPLAVAIINSVSGLIFSYRVIHLDRARNFTYNIIFAVIFIAIIYGLYFITTFMGAKNIINKKR